MHDDNDKNHADNYDKNHDGDYDKNHDGDYDNNHDDDDDKNHNDDDNENLLHNVMQLQLILFGHSHLTIKNVSLAWNFF